MKKILTTLSAFLIVCASYAQIPVLYYDFENNTSRGTFENAVEQAVNSGNSTISGIAITNVGSGNSASQFNGGANGSGRGIEANGWLRNVTTDPGVMATEYFQFTANTNGLSGLSVRFDAARGNNGPSKVGVLWSTDGTTFNVATTTGNGVGQNWSNFEFQLGASANNQTSVTIRLYAYSAGNSSHYLYVDNIMLSASQISGVKTLLLYDAMGLSLTSGSKKTPVFDGDFSVVGAGSLVRLNSTMASVGTITVGNGATLAYGNLAVMESVTSQDGRSAGATLNLEDGSTLQLTSTDNVSALKATLGLSLLNLNPNATVEYIGNATQYQDASTLTNVVVNNANGVVHSGDVVINGNLTLKNGTMNGGTGKLTIKGNILKTNGAINASNTEVIFNGTAAQSVGSGVFTGSVKKLNISNSNGVTFDTDATITEAINLTSGKLSIGTKKLTIRGAIVRNGTTESGTIDAQNGMLEFGGTLAQDVPAGALQNNKVKNLRISNTNAGGVALNGKMDVTGVLDFGAVNNGKLKSNNNLTLKSDAAGTARVADLTNGGVNSGNTIEGLVTVERYFANNGRRYRLVTPGVTTTTSIRANWQEGVNNTAIGSNINPVPGYGTQITGSGGSANGFDATQTNNASLFTFNATTGGWVAVTNTNTNTLSASRPYLIFLRGDRSVDMNAAGTPSILPGTLTILRATGTLANGDQTASSLGSNGAFNLISNPFASPISWTKIHGNNSSKFEEYYTYWDPKVGQRGAYVTVATSGLKSHATVAATTEIQSGQAFFVKTKAGISTPSLSIREQDKSTTSNISVMRTAGNIEQLGISLFYTDGLNQRVVADGVTAVYGNQFSTSVDAKDALQMASWDEDLAIVREGKSLSIETRPLVTANDTVYLAMARMKVQNYELQFDAADFTAAGFAAYLVDKFTGKETMISTAGTTVVPFSVTTNTASSAASRFMVVFKTATTLPVTYTTVKVTETTRGNMVEWKTAAEENIVKYEVERSTDAVSFTTISGTVAKGQSRNNYSLIDQSPLNGVNYYRIKAIELNGGLKYSQVVVVRKTQPSETVSAYPNPVTGNTVFVQLANMEKGTYTLTLINSIGGTVRTQTVQLNGTTTTESISLPAELAKGVYLLHVKGDRSEKTLSVIRN